MQIVDTFHSATLDMPANSLSYDLANVLSSSSSPFTCDLAAAIESIPNMEPIEFRPDQNLAPDLGPSSSSCASDQCDSTFESLDVNHERTSETSCSTTSSSSEDTRYQKVSKEKDTGYQKVSKEKRTNDDEDYIPSQRLQVTSASGKGNSSGNSGSKKSSSKAGIRKRITPLPTRIYVCDWCFSCATFKSCQGLRLHKTLRCPQRERKLGNGGLSSHISLFPVWRKAL